MTDNKFSFESVPGADPDFSDVANQSDQVQVAFETWVNTAINMMDRGATDTEILAKLSHDGCPDPESVLKRAKMQPMEPEPTEEDLSGMSGRQDIFKPSGDEGQMEESQAIQASTREMPENNDPIRVVVAGVTGTMIGEYEAWGKRFVRVALDTGDTVDVSPSNVSLPDESEDLSSQLQAAIDELGTIKSVDHAAKHLAVWKRVHAACSTSIPSVKDVSEQAKLSVLDKVARQRVSQLTEILDAEKARIATRDLEGEMLPTVTERHMFATESRDGFNVDKFVGESAEIWVSELHESNISDPEMVAESAKAHVASSMYGMSSDLIAETTKRFVEAAERYRARREASCHKRTEKVANDPTPDVPDDALFL